jgi:hypothetical protein
MIFYSIVFYFFLLFFSHTLNNNIISYYIIFLLPLIIFIEFCYFNQHLISMIIRNDIVIIHTTYFLI